MEKVNRLFEQRNRINENLEIIKSDIIDIGLKKYMSTFNDGARVEYSGNDDGLYHINVYNAKQPDDVYRGIMLKLRQERLAKLNRG